MTGAGDTPWLKPDPRLTTAVLEALGAPRATACLVGDSPFDAETARNVGLPAFLVTTGTHDRAALLAAGVDRSFPDLAALARGIFGLEIDGRPEDKMS